MKQIREMLISRLEPLEELLLSRYDRDGTDAALLGYPIGDDSTGFSKGGMISLAARRYLRLQKEGVCADKDRERLLRFFGRIKKDESIKTWGKMSILRTLCDLSDANKLDILDASTVAILEKCTRYDDFVDPVTLKLKPQYPTNYLHVAMECAAMREKIGFECSGMSDRFAERLLEIMTTNSADAWMDEAPPFGRFDTYSVGMNLNLTLAFERNGKAIPEYLKENTRRAVRLYYALRNMRGDTFCYGRSLSLYGEFGALSHILYGIREGYFTEDERGEALSYALAITKKITDFWFDSEKGFFNIWLDGRATEEYRGISRIFETNADACASISKVLRMLDSFEHCEIHGEIQEPKNWDMHKVVFIDEPEKKRILYILRYRDRVYMLPFVGIGVKTFDASYMPFPHSTKYFESPHAGISIPYLTPEVTLRNGENVIPMNYYDKITDYYENEALVIEAEGQLARFNLIHYDSVENGKSSERFSVRYTFSHDTVRVEYDIPSALCSRMIFYGWESDLVSFDNAKIYELDPSGSERAKAPHGAPTFGVLALQTGSNISYTLKIK